jgi:hypothetical protein
MPNDSEMMTMVAQDRDLTPPAMDYGVMDMVAKQNDPMLLEQARKEYPILKDLDIGYKYSPGAGKGFLEYYPPDEVGSPEYPRPKDLPMGKPGIEIFDPKTRPIDVLGDIASHYMIYNDPKMIDYYQQFGKSLSPEQQEFMQNKYLFEKEQYGENRPYEQWYETSGLPGYFRAYPFSQWSPEDIQRSYSPEQIQLLDMVKQYLGVK